MERKVVSFIVERIFRLKKEMTASPEAAVSFCSLKLIDFLLDQDHVMT